jgi:3-hydroxybutyryl-CoA dehydrogenase
MKVAVIAKEDQQKALLSRGVSDGLELSWWEHPSTNMSADLCLDLLFEDLPEHREILEHWAIQQQGLVIVSSIVDTCAQLPASFIRLNGWNGFLENERMELAGGTAQQRLAVEQLLAGFSRHAEWVPDQVGFIAPRVIANIINEAYLALEEKVSDKKQIDIAMQLGTNYPLGPFAWSEKIGLKKVYHLLTALSLESARYRPAHLLQQEANA